MQTKNTSNRLLLIVVILPLLLVQSCSNRWIGSKNAKDAVASEYQTDELDFTYLSSRAKFKYKSETEKRRATAQIRIRKDSLIWFRLTPGVGIEAARGKITQDSLIIIDKLNKQVLSFSFEALSQELDFELSFDLFQSVLIGNMPIKQSADDIIEKKANHFFVTQEVGDLTITNQIGNKTRRLESLLARTSVNENTLDIKYTEFKSLNDRPFAYQALMTLNYLLKDNKKGKSTVDIEHNRVKIETEKLKFPFNIPRSYERK